MIKRGRLFRIGEHVTIIEEDHATGSIIEFVHRQAVAVKHSDGRIIVYPLACEEVIIHPGRGDFARCC